MNQGLQDSQSNATVRVDALAAGFQVHLAKPVKAEALIEAVANVLQQKSAEQPSTR